MILIVLPDRSRLSSDKEFRLHCQSHPNSAICTWQQSSHMTKISPRLLRNVRWFGTFVFFTVLGARRSEAAGAKDARLEVLPRHRWTSRWIRLTTLRRTATGVTSTAAWHKREAVRPTKTLWLNRHPPASVPEFFPLVASSFVSPNPSAHRPIPPPRLHRMDERR